jgi:hypothetical protein
LPKTVRSTLEIRVSLGDLHYDAENFALAAAAYGTPRYLDKYQRKSRRRSMLRGLLQSRRLNSSDSGTFDVTAFNPVSSDIAQLLDKAASLQDQPDECRTMLRTALAEHERHPLLLLCLASAERLAGDSDSCAALATEALTSTLGSPLTVIISIWELWHADYDSEVLRVLSDSSDQNRENEALRAAAGYIYHYWGLAAHAVNAFGEYPLDRWDQRARRGSWWRSGGPYSRLQNSVLQQERTFLSTLPVPEPPVAALTALAIPAPVVNAARADLSSYRLGLLKRTQLSPDVTQEWLRRVLRLVMVIVGTAALTITEFLRWPRNQVGQNVVLAAAVIAATATVLWIIGRLTRRVITRVIIAASSGAAAAFLLQVPRQWPFSAGLVLAALTLVIIADYAISVPMLRVAPRIRSVRWRRGHAQTAVLSDLLDLLSGLAVIPRRHDAGARRQWMGDLEAIAVAIERNFPYILRSGDPDSQEAIAAHAQDVAAALRALKRSVAFPDDTSWDSVTAQLQELARALARGDLASAPARPPTLVATPRRQQWWRQAFTIVRKVLVIVAPPLTVFLLPLTGTGIAWLRLASIVWALLASIVALDPNIADSVAKMDAVLNLLRHAAAPQGGSGRADFFSSPEQEQRPQPSPPVRTPDVYPSPVTQPRLTRTSKRRRRSS